MRWDKKDVTWLKNNLNKYSRKELAKKLNKKESEIRGYCWLYGLKKTKLGKKFKRGGISKDNPNLYQKLRREKIKQNPKRYKELLIKEREWNHQCYLNNLEERREYNRLYIKKWRTENPEKYKEEVAKRRDKNKLKYNNVHFKTRQAIKKGIIIKKDNCELCDDTKNIDTHHPDYNNPYKVYFLCKICHKYIHRLLKAVA